MAFKTLPTDYVDAVWSGLKKYSMINNSDGTVSLQDVTVYSQKEKSFFGASDANRMNEALNYIMNALENGTDLYETFKTYFSNQQTAYENYLKNSESTFEQDAKNVVENVRATSNTQYNSFVDYINSLKTSGKSSMDSTLNDFEQTMNGYKREQQSAFDTWFGNIKGQLGDDPAGNLQNQITDLDDKLSAISKMLIDDDITAPLLVSDNVLLTDDTGSVIVADWHYERASNVEDDVLSIK